MTDSHSTPSSEASQIADIIEQGGFATIFEAQKAQAWKVIVQALRAFAVSDSAQRDAVLAFLRAELNVDEDGDPVGAQPEAGWETGYCSGIRHVYRALKGNAAPQLPSETAKVPTGPAAESAPRCVGVPSPLFDEVLDFLEQYEDMRDGPDGQPQPNSAMRLLSELREAERPSEK